MAETMEHTTTEVVEETTVTTEVEETKPTYEELVAALEEKNKEYAKLKTSFDRASSDVASLKKDLKARKTEEENALEEKADKDRRLAIYEAMERYTSDYEDMDSATAKKLAELDADGDKAGVADVLKSYVDALVKKKSAEALLGRPRVNASTNGSNQITKEQFSTMSAEERSKLYTENKAEYDRLKSLI